MPNKNGGGAGSVLFGTREQGGVGRGLAEFRAGRPVLLEDAGENLICLPVEGLDKDRLQAFRSLCAPVEPRLVIAADEPVALELAAAADANIILALVADATSNHEFVPEPAGPAAVAAIEL